jgi:quercetin dioxygenase-like cupin family protein
MSVLRNTRIKALLITACVLASGSPLAVADEEAPGTTPQINILKKSHLSTDESVEVWIREHIYQPGWKAPTHSHNSDLFIYVVSGFFELTTKEEGHQIYKSGQAVRMRPGEVMDAGNASDVQPLKLAVVQVGGVDKPFVVPVE